MRGLDVNVQSPCCELSIQEFGVPLTAEDAALPDVMRDEYQALHDAQWAAESTREQRAEAFRSPLATAAAAVRRRVLDLQLVAQHLKLLDPRTATSEALEFAVNLMAQAADVGADAAHVQRQQALFAHEVTAFEELQAVQTDVELKELLWRSRGEVGTQMKDCEDGALTEVRDIIS